MREELVLLTHPCDFYKEAVNLLNSGFPLPGSPRLLSAAICHLAIDPLSFFFCYKAIHIALNF